MNTKDGIRTAYDRAASDYAAAMWNELDKKPFDRMMLERFARSIPVDQTVLEIGAGPGEVSGYLSRLGVSCLGTDLSPQMIEQARECFPATRFEVQDFFQLTYPDQSFCGVVGFYAIVNLRPEQIDLVFQEVHRVLQPDGRFLFSFHIREHEDKTEVAEFFDQPGNALTFYYFDVDDVKGRIEQTGFQAEDIVIRYPYQDVEYQSKRAYFLVRKS